jgi:Transposase DDE domain group 1
MQTTVHTRSTGKVRRDVTGGKRGNGHRRHHPVRRPDPRRITSGPSDPGLTGVAGLVEFGAYLRELGVDHELQRKFGHLKRGPAVVYPVGAQMRLLMDLFAVGEHRPFGVESLSGDALFAHLAGGVCPSLDTLYRDLARFDEPTLCALDAMMASHGAVLVRSCSAKVVHLDIDTTVTPLFGEHEGGLLGPNPRYRGRPSYHPILARVAETDTILGAELRPGDRGFGGDDVKTIESWIDRCREAIGPKKLLYVRVDAAADCTAIMRGIGQRGAFYVVKARMTADLCGAAQMTTRWTTVDRDADGKPSRQVAEIEFARNEWLANGLNVRVIAVRSKDRPNGKQLFLWELDDYTVQVFLTNDMHSSIDDLAHRYDGRAGIEPLIAELKGAYGIGKVPSYGFDANHAALLLKMLVHNLLRSFVAAEHPRLRAWRAPWLRRALLCIPGRLITRGRSRKLRRAPRPFFDQRE